jgi:STAM-binding protein
MPYSVPSSAVDNSVSDTTSSHVQCKNSRYDINAWRCGTHSTPSKSMYLDAQQVVHCQATDRDVGPCAVKHHFPSPIVSWIEDLSSFGNVSFSPDSEYVDEQARASVGQSSTSSNLRDMQISVRLTEEFMELAKENTSNNLETCGILGASFRDGTYFVTMLIIPKQEGTAHSVCQ